MSVVFLPKPTTPLLLKIARQIQFKGHSTIYLTNIPCNCHGHLKQKVWNCYSLVEEAKETWRIKEKLVKSK